MKLPLLLLVLISFVGCQSYPGSAVVSVRQTPEQMEKEEFSLLMKQDSLNKQLTAAESLDVLLNEDPKDKRVSLIINNNSNCNIILRFAGENSTTCRFTKTTKILS